MRLPWPDWLRLPLLRRVVRERATQVGLAIAGLLGVVLALNPLLGVHGIEAALVLGVVLPFVAAVLSGRAVVRLRQGAPERPGTLRRILEASLRGFLLWVVPVAILALNQLRIRNCEPGVGFAYMVLGPGIGLQLASLATLLVAAAAPRAPTFFALLVPLSSVIWGLAEFWGTPAIFVYAHLVGWFPGTLYDVGRAFPLELITYRGLTLCWWLAVALLLLSTHRRGTGRLSRPRLRTLLPALALVGAGLAGWASGPALGHRSTVAAIDEALGARHQGERCVVHAPRELPRAEAWRLVRDCDFRVHRAEEALGVTQDAKVHAFFYRSAEEKRRWMGAANIFIAKPWRDEVHLQLSVWPHPVLSHEVVHVVAGEAAQGPFEVGGSLGGWLPDPALIEGMAVAVDWPLKAGMDPHQWSQAMRELELLPPLKQVVGLSFLSLPARIAYSAAGSFTRFYGDTFGTAALREAYATGDFEGPAGESLAELERQWHAHLETQVLEEGALDLAALFFDPSSIFETTCPHRLANLKQELGADLAAGDEARARHTCGRILDIDPGSASTRAALVGVLARQGDQARAREQLEALEGASSTLRAQAREGIADALWLRGESDEALAIYQELLGTPQLEGTRRTLQVKILAIEAGGRQERILRDLFLGPSARGASVPAVVHFAHLLDGLRDDGLGRYLAARQLIGALRYDLAASALAEARERGLPSEDLEREALRLEAQAAFGAGQIDRSETLWREALADAVLRPEAEEWLARIAWRRDR